MTLIEGILKSVKQIDAVGTLDGNLVDRAGTVWMPVPDRKDTYLPVRQDGGPAFLRRLRFVFAKTLTHMPHWWTRRTPDNEDDYAALWRHIHDHGVMEMYASRKYKYRYPGDGFRYWYMGALYNKHGGLEGDRVSKIINRTRAGIQPISEADKLRLAEYQKWKAGLPNTEEHRWKKQPEHSPARGPGH